MQAENSPFILRFIICSAEYTIIITNKMRVFSMKNESAIDLFRHHHRQCMG